MGLFHKIGTRLGRQRVVVFTPNAPWRLSGLQQRTASHARKALQPNRPKDHQGNPLSDAALASARAYWDCQRRIEARALNEKDAEDEARQFTLFRELSRRRNEYTCHVLGVSKLGVGDRTREPPYIEDEEQLAPASDATETTLPDVQIDESCSQELELLDQAAPRLCPEQQMVVQLAVEGKNIFYTGSAGCGKSTVLHAITERLREMDKKVHVMAPTGKAALAINGTTTWTYAGWNPNDFKNDIQFLSGKGLDPLVVKRFKQTDTIIIDEISMVDNFHFQRLSEVMKSARSDPLPFGGVQVIVTGDFCQLPPVKPFQHCIDCGSDLVPAKGEYTCVRCDETYNDSDKWAFRSKAWAACKFVHTHLHSIHRQSDADFIELLQKCRLGTSLSEDEIDILVEEREVPDNATKLFPTRDEVGRINKEEFERLESPPYSYISLDKFKWNRKMDPHLASKCLRHEDGSLRALNDHHFDREVQLKLGMPVILLLNLDLTQGLYNGSQGTIIGFHRCDEDALPKHARTWYGPTKQHYVRLFAERNKQRVPDLSWPVVRFSNGRVRIIYPESIIHALGDRPRRRRDGSDETRARRPGSVDEGDDSELDGLTQGEFEEEDLDDEFTKQQELRDYDNPEPYSLLSRTQIPLAPAWAMSIHKSQGMTLDYAVVDLSRAWEHGQAYVAISRVRKLDGLKILGGAKRLKAATGGNPQVQEFLKEKLGM